MSLRTHYVLGFGLSTDGGEVLLIQKTRPDWQAGRLNGVGGKIEPGETPAVAMRREFREETGLDLGPWAPYTKLESRDAVIHVFRATADAAVLARAEALTDETPVLVATDALPDTVLTNLTWLIPLALDTEPEAVTLVRYPARSDRARPIVYLAGPIAGCSDAETFGWRREATALLAAHGIDVLDPTQRDYREVVVDDHLVVEPDKDEIAASDAVLLWHPHPSVGTDMECLYAWDLGRPVIAVNASGRAPSPWLTYHASLVLPTLADAVAVLAARLASRRAA